MILKSKLHTASPEPSAPWMRYSTLIMLDVQGLQSFLFVIGCPSNTSRQNNQKRREPVRIWSSHEHHRSGLLQKRLGRATRAPSGHSGLLRCKSSERHIVTRLTLLWPEAPWKCPPLPGNLGLNILTKNENVFLEGGRSEDKPLK